MAQLADLAVVGTGVMGRSLARNFVRHGHTVALFDATAGRAAQVARDHGDEGLFLPVETLEELAESVRKPRVAILLVPAGQATEQAIDSLCDVFQDEDIIVDMGNAFFADTQRREETVTARGLHFVGCGISGGEQGALIGPAIMPGGPRAAYDRLGPLLESICAQYEGSACCTWVGPGGAGHYVKMVHNGIEYADMELLSEAYQLLRYGAGMNCMQIAQVFDRWNQGPLGSYLLGISVDILKHIDPGTQKPFIDIIDDAAGQKGTGSWTVQHALELGAASTVIAAATFARAVSSQREHRVKAMSLAGPPAALFESSFSQESQEKLLENLEQALYCSKIVAYSQGLSQIHAASSHFHWGVDLGQMARIWRAGCIIQGRVLSLIMDAYKDGDVQTPLVLNSAFSSVFERGEKPWRFIVADGVRMGIPLPALSAALNYYDSLRTGALPTALVQAQRDYFGAHTYQRLDKKGIFHTRWEDPNVEEIEL